jgi:MoaA/NifB/PqqE/SkfB family radical SAM enzyme
MALTEKEKTRRSKLAEEKPLAYAKIMQYPRRRERGECCAIIDFVWSYACNLHCTHCLATKVQKKDTPLTLEKLRDIAEQADALGLAQFNISGGEPLIQKNIESVIAALLPDRFHLSISTNGMFLTEELALRLKKAGLDKVRISVDSISETKTALQRGNKSQYKLALEALKIAKQAGFDVSIQHMVTHQTVQGAEFIDLLEYAAENGYVVDVLPARALGEYEGCLDVLITDEDSGYLKELHKEYPVLRWDMIPSYGADVKSCGAVTDNLHITGFGDVQPCAFIQISLGNVFDESLADIVKRGMSIKHFREFRGKCLSGEDRAFIEKYLSKCYGKPIPVPYTEIFTDDDFLEEN